MTNRERDEIISFWRLSDLENAIMKCENCMDDMLNKLGEGDKYGVLLMRSYARGIIVMKEIICLLKGGFPDGALNLSRRIYEQMITLLYLENNKRDDDFQNMIDRYCDNQNVVAYKNSVAFYKLVKQNSKKEDYEKKLSDLVNKYKSADLKENEILYKEYWWTKEKVKTFHAIEKLVDNPFLHILYCRACISTHASAIGDFALLGRENSTGEKIYTGGTYNGFSTPLLFATRSFDVITRIVFESFNIEEETKVQCYKFTELSCSYREKWNEEINSKPQ